MKAKPPCNYFGGKAGQIGSFIAGIVNATEHHKYLEPFGGMAGVMFHKLPSPVEIYNDQDSRLSNLFQVLRDPKKAGELKARLKLTFYGRDSYHEAHEVLRTAGTECSIRTAWATYVALSMAIQPSLRHNGFRNGGVKYESSVAQQWKRRCLNLDLVTERIRDMVIENKDAVKIMLQYNAPDVFIYCDPPYVHSTRNKIRKDKTVRDYSFEMTDVEHELFLIVCEKLKAKVLISGYDNDLYNYYLQGWERIEIPVVSGIAAANNNPEDTGQRTEVLWANFKVGKQLNLFNND